MRLLVHVEGETEKAFIDGVVAPHLEGPKVAFAPIAARAIGLDAIRRRCANFARWLERLEGVAPAGA